MIYRDPLRPDELYHHGILGQKWGKRNGPPYPLDSKASAKIKKKGEKEFQKRYKEREDKIKSGKLKRTAKDRTGMSQFMSDRDNNIMEGEFRLHKGATTPHLASPSIVIRDFERDLKKIPPGYEVKTPVNNSKGQVTKESVSKINPDFGELGTTNNCTKCSANLALQQMGYNTRAGRSLDGANNNVFGYWFEGAQRSIVPNSNADKELSDQGPGSFGSIRMTFNDEMTGQEYSSHSIFYKVDNDGNVGYSDGQNGKQFSSFIDACNEYGANTSSTSAAQVWRLDKAKPNWEHMAEDSVIASPEGTHRGWMDRANKKVYERY